MPGESWWKRATSWLKKQNGIPDANKESSGKEVPGGWGEGLAWLPAGHPRNPFNVEVLDCRPIALRFMAFTTIQKEAETFNQLRSSDGSQFIGRRPDNTVTIDTELRYPFNGQHNPGPLYKAQEMEEQWDIYAYGNAVYLTRSWTGAVIHVLECEYAASCILVHRIFSDSEATCGEVGFAAAEVNFLLITHLGKSVWPFPIPSASPRLSKALVSAGIATYGRWAQFGTYEWKNLPSV